MIVLCNFSTISLYVFHHVASYLSHDLNLCAILSCINIDIAIVIIKWRVPLALINHFVFMLSYLTLEYELTNLLTCFNTSHPFASYRKHVIFQYGKLLENKGECFIDIVILWLLLTFCECRSKAKYCKTCIVSKYCKPFILSLPFWYAKAWVQWT